MTQFERVLARIVKTLRESPGQTVTISVVLDTSGEPVCWNVSRLKVEGLQPQNSVIIPPFQADNTA
jgi:hypothetical protein